jgi:hypothetical protein
MGRAQHPRERCVHFSSLSLADAADPHVRVIFLPTSSATTLSKNHHRSNPCSNLHLPTLEHYRGYISRARAPLRSILPCNSGHRRPEAATPVTQP